MRVRTVVLITTTTVVAGLMLTAAYLGKRPSTSEEATHPAPLHEDKRTVSARERADAIARAHVWRAPKIPIARAVLRGAAAPPLIECRFKMTDLGGTTPKFHCLLDSGREIRTKYGGVPEIPAEAAATMADTPAALQLRLLQTIVEVAAERNSTLVLPFPVELLRFLERSAARSGTRTEDLMEALPADLRPQQPSHAAASPSR